MDTSPDAEHRTHYRADPGDVELRDPETLEDTDDGIMTLRLPVASTGDVRNEGDEPLTRDELAGMARQINDRAIGVFPEHGMGTLVDQAGYSQFEKLGYWSDAAVEGEAADDGADLLMATANMPDPETLPAATGDYRNMLAILKEQADRGVPIEASIGWRDDEDAPGGNDLMEVSIVGIGADPRTNTDGETAGVVARAAVQAGADPDELIASVREAVEKNEMTDSDDPPEEDTGDTTDEQTADDGDTTTQGYDDKLDRIAEMNERECEMLERMDDMLKQMGGMEDEDEDDEEMAADTDDTDTQDTDDTDGEQSSESDTDDEDDDRGADTDVEIEVDADTSDLRAEIQALKDELDEIRHGDEELESPDEDTRDADDGEESTDTDETENRDSGPVNVADYT